MEIYVFPNESMAKDQGFRDPQLRHVKDPSMVALLVSRGAESIRGRNFKGVTRVVVTDAAGRAPYHQSNHAYEEYRRFMRELEIRVFRDAPEALWLQL